MQFQLHAGQASNILPPLPTSSPSSALVWFGTKAGKEGSMQGWPATAESVLHALLGERKKSPSFLIGTEIQLQ